ncbi:(Dimethylallyl)adenosine tRNAmethylthiotransferase MiaB [Striga asiatica]|uniref:(Dimethylallyl)adenosine tRNAmethylthiotransferase MiaB n=1 Tax=Striga asiatica TaxID=4170 RepID=A0A5A7NZN7_STRAF|nr:(Dimethylallyl)adenosine tRNAmethylthiotransferase MiaB [Striga asiatica]
MPTDPLAGGEIPHLPFARESENFTAANSGEISSSPEPTPSQPTGIFMVSPPASVTSTQQQVEDDAVFLTPPEHHLPSYFSADDQNLDGSPSDSARPLVRHGKARIDRSSDRGWDDGIDPHEARVPAEALGGETIPADETEAVFDETEAPRGAHDETEVIVVDSTDSGGAWNLDDDSMDIIRAGEIVVVPKTGELPKDGLPKVKGNHGNRRSEDIVEALEDIRVNRSKELHETGHSVNGSELSEKIHTDGNLKTKGKSIEEIDKFRYVSARDGQGSRKRAASDVSGLGRKRHLPVTLEGKGKCVEGQSSGETMESKKGLLDFLNVLRIVVGDKDCGGEDVDFLETAKKRGLTFPRPRWWLDKGDDE